MAQANYWLVVMIGPQPGKKIGLPNGEVILGRDPAAGIVIDSPAVSRRHARLWLQDGIPWIEDLNSSNGTYVNAEKIQGQVALKPGDSIRLGHFVVVELGGAMPAAPISADDLAGTMETTAIEITPGVRDTIPGEAPTLADQSPRLEVIIAGGKPAVFPLNQPVITIGRLEDNDIPIPSPIVSRRHALIRKSVDGYRLEMLDQVTNPLMLEGRPLTDTRLLHHGDQMRIGGLNPEYVVVLRYLDPLEAAQLPSQPVSFETKETITLGRDPENDVVIASPRVSRFHARIQRLGSRFMLTDLSSTNGTYINDRRVEGSAWITAGDTIRIDVNRFVIGASGKSPLDSSSGQNVHMG